MSKQWGHGFYAGKNQVISDLMMNLVMNKLVMNKPVKPFHAPVHMRQDGGKYCLFQCPLCLKDSGFFKMSANIGHCENCGGSFINFDAAHELKSKKGSLYPDFVGIIEINDRGFLRKQVNHFWFLDV